MRGRKSYEKYSRNEKKSLHVLTSCFIVPIVRILVNRGCKFEEVGSRTGTTVITSFGVPNNALLGLQSLLHRRNETETSR